MNITIIHKEKREEYILKIKKSLIENEEMWEVTDILESELDSLVALRFYESSSNTIQELENALDKETSFEPVTRLFNFMALEIIFEVKHNNNKCIYINEI